MITTRTAGKVIAGFFLAVIISLMLTCGAELSHGATIEEEMPRVIRELVQQENPNTSLVGNIIAGAIVFDEDGRAGTALRIHPKGMYALYDQTVTFCGDQTTEVATPDGRILTNDLVFTYRRAASRLIDGIPCFDLRSVYPILERRTF